MYRGTQLFADGIFDTIPAIDSRIYTIYGEVFGFNFPCFYVLCTRKIIPIIKFLATYLRLFQTFVQFSPETFMIDFEMAAISAIKTSLPNTCVRGCLFHFNKSLWRKIQVLELSFSYRNLECASIKKNKFIYCTSFLARKQSNKQFKIFSVEFPHALF